MNKQQMIDYLINEFGLSEDELKDSQGKFFVKKVLEAKISQLEELENDLEDNEEAKSFLEQPVKVESKPKEFKDTDMIEVMSGINGQYIHHSSQTGRAFMFKGFGQVTKMPYAEIITLRNFHPNVLENGWIVILDNDVVKDFGLSERYENILTRENVRSIFNKNPEELEKFIRALPSGMRITFVDLAKNSYKKGELSNIHQIKIIQNLFDISLEDNSPISTIALEVKEYK